MATATTTDVVDNQGQPEQSDLRDPRTESAMDRECRSESIRELGHCLDKLSTRYVSELQRAISEYVIGQQDGRDSAVKSLEEAAPIVAEILQEVTHEDYDHGNPKTSGAVRMARDEYAVCIMSPWQEDDSRDVVGEAIIRCTPRELIGLAHAVRDGLVNRN